MAAKGYLAESQLVSERQTLARMRHELRQKPRVNSASSAVFSIPKKSKLSRMLCRRPETAQRRVETCGVKSEEEELAYLTQSD